MKKYLKFFIIILFGTTTFAQYTIRPSSLSIDSIKKVAPNALTFSIYFKNTASDSAINYSGGQFHIDFNANILNGGTGTLSIVNSELTSAVQPTNPTVYTLSTPAQLRLAPKSPPGALIGGHLVNPGDSVLVVKLMLSTSASSFAAGVPYNISWRKAPDVNPITKVSAYIWNSNQIISSNTSFYIYPLSNKDLDLTALIEGFFDGSSMIPDTVTVELHNATSPWSLVDQCQTVLNTSGIGTANFYSAADAVNYYIVVKHRNSIETWSMNTHAFNSGTLSYNFTTSADKAYGNNLKLKNGKWCIFGGEVANNDQYIDGDDVTGAYNMQGMSGYVLQDVTGDDYVDGDDVTLAYNNQGIGSANPITGFKPNKNINKTLQD